MHEILNTSVLENETRIDISGNSGEETIDKQWTRDDLTPLVSANANVLVMWQGAEATLSDAMRSYLVANTVTEESQDIVIAIVLELLANAVINTEEPAEQDKPEEAPAAETEEAAKKTDATTEVQAAQEDSSKTDSDTNPKKTTATAMRSEPPSRIEKASGYEDSSVIAAKDEMVANLVHGEPKQSNQSAPKTKAVTSPARNQLNGIKPAIEPEVGAKQQIATFEIPKADATATPIVETMPAPDGPRLVADQEPGSPGLSPVDFKSADILDYTSELSDGNIEVAEDEPTLATLDYHVDTSSFTDLAEEEVLTLHHYEEAGLEPDEPYTFSNIPLLEVVEENLETREDTSIFQLGDESNLLAQIETNSQERFVQTSLTIEEIEDSLIQLSERINASEPETTEKVNEILDKIIEVPAKLEADNGEDIITEAQAQEELEELFTELLDRMSIGYTPELIESLARLTLKWHLVDEIEKLKSVEETDKAPQGSGTHEIIKKLLIGLSIIKKAMAHACAIGKSALRLYFFNFAT